MQKRAKSKFQANPVLDAKIAERFERRHEIQTYSGLMVMQDKEKHVLWTVEAKYGYDYWTVESSKIPGIRVSAINFMNEVFHECPEVDTIECINVDLQTYDLFGWSHKKTSAVRQETGDIVFGRQPKLSRSNGQRSESPEQGPTLSIATGPEETAQEVV